MTETNSKPSSSVGGEFVAGLLGAGIAIGCVLPPIVHLVTGPLGPFLGGFVAANRVNAGPRGRTIIAVTIGTTLAGLGTVAALVFKSLAGTTDLPSWFPANGTLGALLAGAWIYGMALGAVGTLVSSAIAGRRATTDEPGDEAPRSAGQ